MNRSSVPTRSSRITSLVTAARQLATDVRRQPGAFTFGGPVVLDKDLNAGNALGFVIQRAGASQIVGTRPARDPKRALAEALSCEVGNLPLPVRRAAVAVASATTSDPAGTETILRTFAAALGEAKINTRRKGRTPTPYVAGRRSRAQREVQATA